MTRSLSDASKQALYAPETAEAFLILLTLDHEGLAEPIRVTSDAVNTVSRGETFIAYPFDLTLPDDEENKSPRARLVIDNIDRQIVAVLRSLATPPTMKIEIIRAADPDTVEATFEDFRLINVTYDSSVIEGELAIEDFTAEPYPAASFTPGNFPGIF